MVYCRVLLRALSGAQPLVPSRCAGLKRKRLRVGGGGARRERRPAEGVQRPERRPVRPRGRGQHKKVN